MEDADNKNLTRTERYTSLCGLHTADRGRSAPACTSGSATEIYMIIYVVSHDDIKASVSQSTNLDPFPMFSCF